VTQLRSGSATDVGRVRQVNQDCALEAGSLFAVADGMGGHAGGEVASRTAIDTLARTFQPPDEGLPPAELLIDAVEEANRAVWEQAQADTDLWGMGTTLTTLALVEEGGREELAVANVGDSRAYLLSGGDFTQLTADHSLVEEMVRSGELSAAQAAHHPKRHIITRVIGIEPTVDVDAWLLRPVTGDRILLCSDGLVDEVSDEDIASVLQEVEDPGQAARDLVTLAREHGGRDNITVIVVDVVAGTDDGVAGAGTTSAGTIPAEPPPFPDTGGDTGDRPPSKVTSPAPAPGGAGVALATATRMPVASRVQASSTLPTRPRPLRTPEAPPRSPRPITLRVVGFLVLLLAVIAAVVGAVAWYATGSYYVGLAGRRVAIYQGRPGGFLWFQPHVVDRTTLTTRKVLPSRLPDLRAGMQEPSLAAARRYVTNLRQEAASLPQFHPSHTRSRSSTTTTSGRS
jgi:serine/threonine protein phosphatase PrpC